MQSMRCAFGTGHRRSHARPGSQRPSVATQAHRSNKTYYEILGIPRTASEDDIKSAFRRKAKELHPDVNKDDNADAAFIEATKAYETLIDPNARAEYDRVNSIGRRRINFFTEDEDLDEYGDPITTWSTDRSYGYNAARPDDDDDDDDGRWTAGDRWRYPSRDEDDDRPGGGFGWGDLGGRRGRGRRRRAEDEGDADQDEDDGTGGTSRDNDDDDGPNQDEMSEAEREAKRLEQIFRLMNGFGPDGILTRLQRGGVDPWGQSSSDSWQKRVEEQTQDPWRNRGYSSREANRFDRNNTEWAPPGRSRGPDDDWNAPRPGWAPPGRDGPRRAGYDDDGNDRGGRGGGGVRWGGGDGFGGKPLI